MGLRAGIVVTGTEVLTGRVADRNGPWLAERLRRSGVDVGQIVVVGDRPEDLHAALAHLAAGNQLVITTGGLGPTADDLTAEVVAGWQGRPLGLDPDLERRIAAIVARLSARFDGLRDPEATAAATRKQAMVPAGASVLEPVGTAPGLVVPVAAGRTGPPVIVLPGPPGELRQMWPAALAEPGVSALLAGASELRQDTLRLWGVPESELAATLRRLEGRLAGLEITTCLRSGELEIVSRYAPPARDAQLRLVDAVRADFADQLFSVDGRTVDELVGAALAERKWSVAVMEEASAGAVCARLAGCLEAEPGLLAGGFVVGSAPPAGLDGPAGPGVALAMARQARSRLAADVGIGVSGIDDSTTVHLSVLTPDGERARSLGSGSPEVTRQRIGPGILHLLRQVLAPG